MLAILIIILIGKIQDTCKEIKKKINRNSNRKQGKVEARLTVSLKLLSPSHGCWISWAKASQDTTTSRRAMHHKTRLRRTRTRASEPITRLQNKTISKRGREECSRMCSNENPSLAFIAIILSEFEQENAQSNSTWRQALNAPELNHTWMHVS